MLGKIYRQERKDLTVTRSKVVKINLYMSENEDKVPKGVYVLRC